MLAKVIAEPEARGPRTRPAISRPVLVAGVEPPAPPPASPMRLTSANRSRVPLVNLSPRSRSPATRQESGNFSLKRAACPCRPHMMYLEASGSAGMAKYRMDIFKPGRKPGHPAPLLWRRRDIYASDDSAAKAEAADLYRTDAAQRTLTHFYLCDSAGRSISAPMEEDPNNSPNKERS